MSDKARAIADAAMPGGVCAGPAPPQTTHRDTPQLSCPECGPDLDVFYMTFDPPTVAAMLDALEAAQVVADLDTWSWEDRQGALQEWDQRIARVRDLIGDDREDKE